MPRLKSIPALDSANLIYSEQLRHQGFIELVGVRLLQARGIV